jgi:hypothetical protein
MFVTRVRCHSLPSYHAGYLLPVRRSTPRERLRLLITRPTSACNYSGAQYRVLYNRVLISTAFVASRSVPPSRRAPCVAHDLLAFSLFSRPHPTSGEKTRVVFRLCFSCPSDSPRFRVSRPNYNNNLLKEIFAVQGTEFREKCRGLK